MAVVFSQPPLGARRATVCADGRCIPRFRVAHRYGAIMPPEMTEQVAVRLTPELLDQIKTVADTQERTVAQTIRLAIKAYLSETATAEALRPAT